MALITVTPADVRPLPGALILRFVAGGAVNVGDAVYVDSAGKVIAAIGTAAPAAHSIGVVLSVAGSPKTAAVLNDAVDVAVWGPVTGFSGMTPGDILYQSDTLAKFGDAAGTVTHKIGKPLTATVLFLRTESEEA
jgi:ATP-dependent protease ClpP protease subunit